MTQAPENGGSLLDEVRAWLARYIVTVSPTDLDLLTLWTVHTHLVEQLFTTPRLLLDSMMPGSGKTTVLEHMQRLAYAPIQAASLSSPALLTRMLDAGMRTVLIDEADRSLDPKKEGVGELLAVVNSGYKSGATRPVLVPAKGGKWDVAEMPTYAPIVLAGNNPSLPDDTRARCIRVLLLPDLHGVADESDWELIEPAARDLGERISTWAESVREQIRHVRPPLPEGITGRFREKWAPLRRVAELAGGRWPDVVDALAVDDKQQSDLDREDGLVTEKPAVLLLRHLAETWPDGVPFRASTEIADDLAITYPTVWGQFSPYGKELTTHRLGRMLAQACKVNSDRIGGRGPRGYSLARLEPVWHRLNLTPPNTSGASG